MIKINLLEGARPRSEPKLLAAEPAALPAFQAKVFGASLGVLVIIVSFFYWYWTRQINNLNQKITVEQAEANRLQAIQAENQRYAQQLSEMERRITTIKALEANRKGPVQLMASVSSMVNRTSGLYLVSVASKENALNMQGESPTVGAIADFVAVLRTSGDFEDVKLEQYFESDKEERASFKFILDCLYKSGSPLAGTQAAAAPGPAKAPQGAAGAPPPVRM